MTESFTCLTRLRSLSLRRTTDLVVFVLTAFVFVVVVVVVVAIQQVVRQLVQRHVAPQVFRTGRQQ